MLSFEQKLIKILSEENHLNKVDPKQFLYFLNAIVTASDPKKTEAALKKAVTFDNEKLASIIAKSDPIKDITGLENYIKNENGRVVGLQKLASKLFDGPILKVITQVLAPPPRNRQCEDDCS